MTEKQFKIETERILNTYAVRILKEDEVIFEITNWNSLSELHTKECEELVNLLNTLSEENKQLKKQLDDIENSYEFRCTQNRVEIDKDEIHVKDTHSYIQLKGRNLFMEFYLPQINEYMRFQYTITGKSLLSRFIEDYHD